MMEYKGIDKEKILEVQKVKLPNADAYAMLTEVELKDLCKNTNSFKRKCLDIKKQCEARMNDTEMAIICEMAMMYLESLKAKEVDDKESYNKGLNDAWELARKLYCDISSNKLRKIYEIDGSYDEFGLIVRTYTPQEALAKLEAYEKEQAEIKVGDVVIYDNASTKGVVTKVKDETIYILFRDGSDGEHKKDVFKKTGKHIDIQKLLDELKEG